LSIVGNIVNLEQQITLAEEQANEEPETED